MLCGMPLRLWRTTWHIVVPSLQVRAFVPTWSKVVPKQLFGIAAQGIFALGLAITRRYLLGYSWRRHG